ncbi:SGNH/GDSL hydrolase family protein [Gorillibacterium sp. sgz5001074]|uniref:SGNH/GDSL hydrolase family protein n=1 Tax=Gorillibacterium sp. sgz5001074 TaxID=3446695 RepID=UPI003F676535
MLFGNVWLHNIEEAAPVEGGFMLERVPRSVGALLRESTQAQYRRAGASEIRFVSIEGKPVTVTLSCPDGNGTAYLYYGDFPCGTVPLTPTPVPVRMEPQHPYHLLHEAVKPEPLAFSRQVWRILLHGSRVCLHGIEGEAVRPPLPGETPELTYLAYGTSITFGEAASVPDVTYVMQAGRHLGADVLNLGAAGSCHCEPGLADYIAVRRDWDVASLCISINMLNQGISLAEYSDKASYMAYTVASRNPGKPVVCIGLFPSFADFGLAWPDRHPAATAQEYRDTLRRIVEESGLSNLHYIDGRTLLTRYSGLSHDLLHPNHHGMIEIGRNLAEAIGPLVRRKPEH